MLVSGCLLMGLGDGCCRQHHVTGYRVKEVRRGGRRWVYKAGFCSA
jgi:hypothetical protein